MMETLIFMDSNCMWVAHGITHAGQSELLGVWPNREKAVQAATNWKANQT